MSGVEVSDTLLHVRASPGAKRSAVVGRYGGGWKISIAAPAEGGRANSELVRLLAAVLEVPERSVSIVSGSRSRDKKVAIEAFEAAEAHRRLAAAAGLTA